MKTVQIDRVAFSSNITQAAGARRVAGVRRALKINAVADVQEHAASTARPKVSLIRLHQQLLPSNPQLMPLPSFAHYYL